MSPGRAGRGKQSCFSPPRCLHNFRFPLPIKAADGPEFPESVGPRFGSKRALRRIENVCQNGTFVSGSSPEKYQNLRGATLGPRHFGKKKTPFISVCYVVVSSPVSAPPKFNGLGTIGGYHSIALFCLGNHIASTPLGFADVGAASVGMVATMRVTIGTMGIKAPAVSRIGCESWNRTRARRSPL